MDLNTIWFFLLGILLAGYAILDGFDLGVGILHPFVRNDRDRRVLLNSIGPFWDGNEVWLVTFGGAMFAAFPEVYATVFSGLYTALMLLLCALIFRAISLELRSKLDQPGWRSFWDWAFALGSGVATLLFGVAVGNAMTGLPVKEVNGHIEYVGTFFNLLGPYQLLVGVFTLAMFRCTATLPVSRRKGASAAGARVGREDLHLLPRDLPRGNALYAREAWPCARQFPGASRGVGRRCQRAGHRKHSAFARRTGSWRRSCRRRWPSRRSMAFWASRCG